MAESKEVLWSKLKVGDWVYHTDFTTKEYLPWRVFNVETRPSMLVLVREQLAIKRFKLERGTYAPGRANCTAILAPLEPCRMFELAPPQKDQFEWLKPEVNDEN